MTAEEIRKKSEDFVKRGVSMNDPGTSITYFLAEIAAQLAEANALTRFELGLEDQ